MTFDIDMQPTPTITELQAHVNTPSITDIDAATKTGLIGEEETMTDSDRGPLGKTVSKFTDARYKMVIGAISDGKLGKFSFLTHWTSVNCKLRNDFYTKTFTNDDYPEEEIGLKLYDATTE